MRIFYLSFLLSLMVVSAQAGERILDRSTLLDMVSQKVLILRLFGIKLKIMEDGRIEGKAMGRDVVGDWEWQDGFFCRSMPLRSQSPNLTGSGPSLPPSSAGNSFSSTKSLRVFASARARSAAAVSLLFLFSVIVLIYAGLMKSQG